MKNNTLFGDDGTEDRAKKTKTETAEGRAVRLGKPRIAMIDRSQVTLAPFDVDGLVRDDHPVRQVWAFVQRLDVTPLLERIHAREHGPGRPATDPRVLFALWLYALHKKIASSHELARLCVEHSAFRWLCGDKPINQHTLSDFRSTNKDAFDEVLVELLAALFRAGILKMKRVAQDGMKTRASAGQGSFHRERTLKKSLKAARARLRAAKKALNDPKKNERKKAAGLRAAEERAARLERALAELPAVRATNTNRKEPEEARVSTTDADARVMRMGDGGFRPAFNVQLTADTETRLVVGAYVCNVGSDHSQLGPMLDNIEERTGKLPEEVLLDGGYVTLADIDGADDRGVTTFAPPRKARKGSGIDPHVPKATDSDVIAAWRERMKTDEAKEIYKERSATIETVNADLKHHRGLDAVNVRGLDRVSSVFLLGVLGYNAMRIIALGALGALEILA